MNPNEIEQKLSEAKSAGRVLRQSSQNARNQVLGRVAALLLSQKATLLKQNQKDLDSLPIDTPSAFRDRLLINDSRLEQMVVSLKQVVQLEDPIGLVESEKVLKNGLRMKKVRSPLGVIFMIFESRPNVAVEAFSLALKSGNVIILRGGKESMHTTSAFYRIFEMALREAGLPERCVWGIETPDRDLVGTLLKADKNIDVVVPRGGDKLIEFVVEHSKIPIIKNDRGLCHVYIDESADLKMAEVIVENAKTQRPGVCNAMETLLVHKSVAPQLLPALYKRLAKVKLQWFACSESLTYLPKTDSVKPAELESWDTEYLDLKMNCRVVKSLDEAMDHIEKYGSHHSESIVTSNESAARKFQSQVDAAAVYWNASTRFTDGFEFGLGGELGISTQKLHVRGPVGLKELTSLRWIIDGSGQTR